MGTFHSVARTSDLAPGTSKGVTAGGKRIALYNVDGAFHAIEDNCNHRGGPLSEGELDGKIVTCPWHGARFDVTTGDVKGPPAQMPMRKFTVQIQGDEVLVEV